MADKFELIAKVIGVGKKKAKNSDNTRIILTLEEATGHTFDWSTFHETALNPGAVHKFLCSRPPNPQGNNPFRNVDELLGAADGQALTNAPRPGVTPPPAGDTGSESGGNSNGGGGYGKSPADRTSIERQSSLKFVAGLRTHMSVEDIEEEFDRLLALALRAESQLSRPEPSPSTKPAASKPAAAKPVQAQPPPTNGVQKDDTREEPPVTGAQANGWPDEPRDPSADDTGTLSDGDNGIPMGVPVFEDVGQFINKVRERWGKDIIVADICLKLGIQHIGEISGFTEAWVELDGGGGLEHAKAERVGTRK